MHHQAGPPAEVLARFGAAGPARRLPGGQGRSWLAGPLVLKPDTDPDLRAWLVSDLARIRRSGFRLADPAPTIDGGWIHDGWSASTFLPGVDAVTGGAEPARTGDARWGAVIEAGRALHRATAALPRPAFLDRADSWWAIADRAAWAELTVRVDPALRSVVRRLRGALTSPGEGPLGQPQLVHGDLTGNVLFAPGEPPAIIDVSPYWRPPAYAEGIVLADAMTWHGAPASLLDDLGVPLAAVARGLLFRVITSQLRAHELGESLAGQARRYQLAMDALGI